MLDVIVKKITVFLSKQISYTSGFKNQFLISIILGLFVAFIMVFLQPYDTSHFESDDKFLILSGFGILFSLIYLVIRRIEKWWYIHLNKRWTIKHEIISFLSLIFVSSIIIHFYNQVFLNDFFNHKYKKYEYFKHEIWFFHHSILPIIVMILPFYVYFRNKFGELTTSESLSKIEFHGMNKGEKIAIQKEMVLYVKASENYVQIYYCKDHSILYETFRNTLIAINQQAPFLQRCHRSYLVNISAIKTVKGNSQNAKIVFHQYDLDIPLSKSYYKNIKSAINK